MQVWPFMPQKGLTESLEWLTDVIRCRAGEDRVPLRHIPRQGYQFNCQLDPTEYGRARTFARENSQEFLLPVWPHYHNVGDLIWGATSINGVFDQRFYTDRIIVWESASKWEVLDLSGNTGTVLSLATEVSRNYTDAAVAPLQVVRFAQAPDFAVGNSDIKQVNLRVRAIKAVVLTPSVSLPQHRGKDVLLDPNILVRQLKEQHYREVDEVDSYSGIVASREKYAAPETKSTMSWHPLDRVELLTTLEWIHSRRGRFHAFWYRSHNKDLVPRSSLAANTDPLYPVTDKVEVTRIEGLKAPFDIAITSSTGARRFYRVQAVQNVSTDRMALILTGNAGASWPQAELAGISFLVGVRFDADRVEVRYTQGGAATISVPIIEVPGL